MQTKQLPLASTVDKRGERVRAMFAGIARRYDLLNHLLSCNIDKRWRRFTVDFVAPRPDSTDPILDVCTGTGDLALGYDAAVDSRITVVGADFCHEMLVIARRKNLEQRRAVVVVEADALQLPFADDTYQIVAIAFGLRNVADTRRGLAELIRVARPGGRVAILEFSRPRNALLRWLYLAYFRHVLPRIGQSVSKSRYAAYHYLKQSVLEFPDGQDMIELLGTMGLREVAARPLTFGIATLYVGTKGFGG